MFERHNVGAHQRRLGIRRRRLVQRDVGPRLASAELQHGRIGLCVEFPEVVGVLRQQTNDIRRGGVTGSKPKYLWRRAAQQAHSMKIGVLRDENAVVLARQFPHVRVGCAAAIKQPYMECARKEIDELPNQGLRQLFVEEQPHGSGRDANRTALALSRVGQACANVVLGQLGKIGQQLGL